MTMAALQIRTKAIGISEALTQAVEMTVAVFLMRTKVLGLSPDSYRERSPASPSRSRFGGARPAEMTAAVQ